MNEYHVCGVLAAALAVPVTLLFIDFFNLFIFILCRLAVGIG